MHTNRAYLVAIYLASYLLIYLKRSSLDLRSWIFHHISAR